MTDTPISERGSSSPTRNAEASAECSFCEIVAGRSSARKVYEDDTTIAFFPLEPATLGHTLVVPRNHVSDLWQLQLAAATPLLSAVLLVGNAIRRALHPAGMNLINSLGEAASQSISHLHLHLVPRWPDDQFGGIWPTKAPLWSDAQKDHTADLIRTAIPI